MVESDEAPTLLMNEDKRVAVARMKPVPGCSPSFEAGIYSANDWGRDAPAARAMYEYEKVFDLLGECLDSLSLDRPNRGTSRWNPLGGLVNPGETVLVKPNLVKESHPRDPDGWQYVLTSGSVIRAACEYIYRALEGRGRIIIADAPQTDSSFSTVASLLQLPELVSSFRRRGYLCDLFDLRREEWRIREGVIVERIKLPGDPSGYVAIDLQTKSELFRHGGSGRYYGADYDHVEVNRHHSQGRHEYLVAGSAVIADVVFSVPKLKTHKKAGVTVGLKNLVGVNGDKNWLPHHTEGSPSNGGDERPDGVGLGFERRVVSSLRDVIMRSPLLRDGAHRVARKVGLALFGASDQIIRSGNWFGNDTIWRMCLDLNKAISYGNADGSVRQGQLSAAKRHYVLVDGIVAGQGSGPMNPDPFPSGLLIFGTNVPSVDAVSAFLMGFDPERIPIIRQAFKCNELPLANWDWPDVEVVSHFAPWNGKLKTIDNSSTFRFAPHNGWKHHIERVGR